jgi:hypothetical protein
MIRAIRTLFVMEAVWIALAHFPAHGQLVSQAKAQRYRALLPRTNDEELSTIFADNLVFYDRETMPRAFQFNDGEGGAGVMSPLYNLSGDPSDNWKPHGSGGTPGAEFPWKHASGTDRVTNLQTFRFIALPKTGRGEQRWPIVWFRRHLSGDESTGFAWIFPKGTVVGEVMMQRGPDGHSYPFEVRTRTRELGFWRMDAYRPFPTLNSLVDRIKELRPNWARDEKLVAWLDYVGSPKHLTVAKIGDTNHPRMAFRPQSAAVDELPPLAPKFVAELLRTPFESSLGNVWRQDYEGPNTYAPTTKAEFHIVPGGYSAGFIDVSETSCVRCHQTANKHADFFDQPRGWYGRVPGSDQIFSFHPFSLGSISYNGAKQPIAIRRELEASRLLERYDPTRHSSRVYHMLSQE